MADELGTQPRQIHLWIEQVLAQAEKVFQQGAASSAKRAADAKDLKIAQLEAKVAKKNEVVQHWHIDVSYINVAGTFYFLCTLLDGTEDGRPVRREKKVTA